MLHRIFLQILDMSFISVFVIIFILIIRFALRKAPKVFSYALWGIVLFRLVCPLSFESRLSLIPSNPASVSIQLFSSQTLETYTDQPSRSGKALPAANDVNGNLSALSEQNIVAPSHTILPDLPASPSSESVSVSSFLLAGTVIWLMGIISILLHSVISLLKLRKKLIGAVRLYDNIYLADHINSPFVIGIIQPRIYLPSILTGMETDYIILHEQTHIRRLDHLVKFLSFAVLILHWFNPLVWLTFILCNRDMEMSCDESVMKQMDRDIREVYSVSLLNLSTGRKLAQAAPLAFGEGNIKGRIKNVLNYKRPTLWAIIFAAATVILACTALLSNPKEISSLGNKNINGSNSNNKDHSLNGQDQSDQSSESTGEPRNPPEISETDFLYFYVEPLSEDSTSGLLLPFVLSEDQSGWFNDLLEERERDDDRLINRSAPFSIDAKLSLNGFVYEISLKDRAIIHEYSIIWLTEEDCSALLRLKSTALFDKTRLTRHEWEENYTTMEHPLTLDVLSAKLDKYGKDLSPEHLAEYSSVRHGSDVVYYDYYMPDCYLFSIWTTSPSDISEGGSYLLLKYIKTETFGIGTGKVDNYDVLYTIGNTEGIINYFHFPESRPSISKN